MELSAESNRSRASLLDSKWPLYSLVVPLLHFSTYFVPISGWRSLMDAIAVLMGLGFVAITLVAAVKTTTRPRSG